MLSPSALAVEIATLDFTNVLSVLVKNAGINDIYRNPNTPFLVRTWSGECMMNPSALAVEIATLDFTSVPSVLVKNAGINQYGMNHT